MSYSQLVAIFFPEYYLDFFSLFQTQTGPLYSDAVKNKLEPQISIFYYYSIHTHFHSIQTKHAFSK